MKTFAAMNLSFLVVLAAYDLVSRAAAASEPTQASAVMSRLAQAETAFAEARKQELAASEVYDSYQMAHAATREIARVERQRASDALQTLKASQAQLKQAIEAGKEEQELARLRQTVQDRLATFRAACDRMLAEARASSKASEDTLVGEGDIRAKMTVARQAELSLLEAKAQAAERAKDPGAAEARRAVHELQLQIGLETQQWPNLRRLWSSEFAEQARESARLAQSLAAAETDAARKNNLERFAAEQGARQERAEKIAAEAQEAMTAATPALYPLRAAASGGLKLLAPEQWDYPKARHLLVRAGFGGTPQEVARLHEMGLYKAVDYLVEFYRQPGAATTFDPVPPLRIDPLVERLTVRTMSSRVAAAQRSVERGQVAGLRQTWLKRMVESPRPLQEKLSLFWHGHFASQESVVQNSYTMYRQNQLFHEHAAGNFGALLFGIVHDPAMLRYLDNNQNVKGKPNENLAREILELFSMGVDQGYTEKDIIEAARALTGYTYDNSTGGYRYHQDLHDGSNKTIFGQIGPWTGDDLVRLILERPHTSRFIARRLFEYFAHEEPGEETVERLSTVLRVHHYDLEPLLKNLFMSAEYYSERAMGQRIKSPVELVVGLLRDLGVKQVTNYGPVDSAIRQMGMELLEPPDVKGWRYGRAWINSQRLLTRYNAAASLIQTVQQARNVRGVDVVALVQTGECQSTEEVIDYLAQACLITPLSDEKRLELVQHLGPLPPKAQWEVQRAQVNERLRSALILLLSMPEYQMT